MPPLTVPPSPIAEQMSVVLSDFFYILPSLVLTAWGLLVLLVDYGMLRGRESAQRQTILGGLALAGTLLALLSLNIPRVLDLRAEGGPEPSLFFGTLAGGPLTENLNAVLLFLLGLVLVMSLTWTFTRHWGEYYALMLWSAVGMMLLIASEELITLFLTLELMTICLYLLTAFEKERRRSPEGGLKYFVYGSVSSALMLFGISLLYGLTGSTRLDAIALAVHPREITVIEGLAGNVAGAVAVLLVLVGFGFKIAAFPFHQWAPDAYEGAPAPVTAWIATGSKLASFVAMVKVFIHGLGAWSSTSDSLFSPGWFGLFAVLAAVTMTYGNFAALAQRNLKRLLAYSSIAHSGYILVGVLAVAASVAQAEAAGAILFYLVVYSFSTIGAFALAAWLARDKGRDEIDDLNGLGAQSPFLATCTVLIMLSLIGLPPLAGFFGKLYMFMEALNTDASARLALIGLVALGLANTIVSAFYYVRVLRAIYLRPVADRPVAPASADIWVPMVAAGLVVVAFGLYPRPLQELMTQTASSRMIGSGLTGARVAPLILPVPVETAPDAPEEAPRDAPQAPDDASAPPSAPPEATDEGDPAIPETDTPSPPPPPSAPESPGGR